VMDAWWRCIISPSKWQVVQGVGGRGYCWTVRFSSADAALVSAVAVWVTVSL